MALQAATTDRGMCATCAAHWWLFTVDGLRWAFEGGPGVLSEPIVQAELSRVLGMMHPELAALDWSRLLVQWALPWPDDWALAHAAGQPRQMEIAV